MNKYINADEMLVDESEAYAKAQTRVSDEATYLINQVVHMKLQRLLIDAPAADVQEVRHGKWAHLGGDEWSCSCCGFVKHTEGSWEKPDEKYCEDCGAKMDGEEAEETHDD